MSERGRAQDSSELEAPTVSGDEPTVAALRASSSPPSRKDYTGHEIAGRYRVLEPLGEGGMGMVYVAEHLHLRKKVAFKVIHPELARHEELLLRFKREALATGQLDHPHIASAIDFGELEGGGSFMVMPLVRGHSLQTEIDHGGALGVRRAALLCSQIADALSAAHAVGIVHRDLKPDNVLIERRADGSESAKVLDFGVASLAGHGSAGGSLTLEARPLTQAGTILGTPGYMSPEQASAGEIDHRTDLYALGVILWELLRGERLFDGDDVTQVFAKQFNTLPPALALGSSAVAREMSTLVARLLAWDKKERPNSATEVRDTLRRLAELSQGLPVSGAAEGRGERVQRYLPYVVSVVALLGAISIVAFDDEGERVSPEDSASAEAEAKEAAETAPATSASTSAHANVSANANPNVNTGGGARTDPRPAASEGKPRPALSADEENLLLGTRRDARRVAARRVLRRPKTYPAYVKLVADLELATRCSEKKDVLAAMRTLDDPRVLPALERLASAPKRGCGLFRLSDCLDCLRRELDQTIGSLDRIGR